MFGLCWGFFVCFVGICLVLFGALLFELFGWDFLFVFSLDFWTSLI